MLQLCLLFLAFLTPSITTTSTRTPGEKCEKHKYGATCSDTCGHCAGNQTCNSVNGRCLPCVTGWKPQPLCTTGLSLGDDCTEAPYGCAKHTECDASQGHVCKISSNAPCNTTGDCANVVSGFLCTFGQCVLPAGAQCEEWPDACIRGSSCNASQGHVCRVSSNQQCTTDGDCANTGSGYVCRQGQCEISKHGPCQRTADCANVASGYICDGLNQCSLALGANCYNETDGCGRHAECDASQGHICNCKINTYGPTCSDTCGRCAGNKPCNSSTGHCLACVPGWTPEPFCTTGLPLGAYCKETPDGCVTHAHCDTSQGHVCKISSHGPCNTTEECAHVAYGFVCDSLGQCSLPLGTYCKKTPDGCVTNTECYANRGHVCNCEKYKYGPTCSDTCGSCAGNQPCDPSTGQCPVCVDGWAPPLCATVLPLGAKCKETLTACGKHAECDASQGFVCKMSINEPCDTTGDCANVASGIVCGTLGLCSVSFGGSCKQAPGGCGKEAECDASQGHVCKSSSNGPCKTTGECANVASDFFCDTLGRCSLPLGTYCKEWPDGCGKEAECDASQGHVCKMSSDGPCNTTEACANVASGFVCDRLGQCSLPLGADCNDTQDGCGTHAECDASQGHVCKMSRHEPCNTTEECANVAYGFVCDGLGQCSLPLGADCNDTQDGCITHAECDASQGHVCKMSRHEPCNTTEECANVAYGFVCDSLGQCSLPLGADCNDTQDGCITHAECDASQGHVCNCANNEKYGPTCSDTCGHCADNQPCNSSTGHCLACLAGWTPPPLCTTAVSGITPIEQIVVGVTVAVLLFWLLLAVFVTLWHILYYRGCCPCIYVGDKRRKKEEDGEDAEVSLDTGPPSTFRKFISCGGAGVAFLSVLFCISCGKLLSDKFRWRKDVIQNDAENMPTLQGHSPEKSLDPQAVDAKHTATSQSVLQKNLPGSDGSDEKEKNQATFDGNQLYVDPHLSPSHHLSTDQYASLIIAVNKNTKGGRPQDTEHGPGHSQQQSNDGKRLYIDPHHSHHLSSDQYAPLLIAVNKYIKDGRAKDANKILENDPQDSDQKPRDPIPTIINEAIL
ncbi:multiple epidermal growth factor-like domains protein 6 [Littorina saxatilis]|uniref:EGF-like domain-containing protein n=1 Tax=Littorina saxatilis TaxID=31220 RepID=A0AAN9B0G8_9CAEN